MALIEYVLLAALGSTWAAAPAPRLPGGPAPGTGAESITEPSGSATGTGGQKKAAASVTQKGREKTGTKGSSRHHRRRRHHIQPQYTRYKKGASSAVPK